MTHTVTTITMYFNSTISDSTKLLKPVLVFAFTIAAALSGLTQVTQYRSHPVDVYAGFCIGAGIAMYLAFHAVSNFKPSEDGVPPPGPPPPQKDALRELAQRGHDSVYQKAHASESNEEIASPGLPALVGVSDGLNRPMQREKASLSSLKRASVNVELLVPRSPMGKETMVTFSNTLPRPAATHNPAAVGPDDAVPQRSRLVTVPVPIQLPMDARHSQQLVSEWKQKSMEMRGMTLRQQEEVVLPPRPPVAPQPPRLPHPHLPGEMPMRPPPPPVSPKSASTRAKWLSLTEKSGAPVRAPGQPRLMQVIAMSKQQGLLSGSAPASPRSSETASSSSITSSSTAGTDSPPYRPPAQREPSAIVTVDAHAPHHPVAQPPGSTNPWEWRGNVGNAGNVGNVGNVGNAGNAGNAVAGSRESYELNELQHGYRVSKRQDVPPLPPQEVDTRSRESLRRKTPLVLLDQSGHGLPEQDYYRKHSTGHSHTWTNVTPGQTSHLDRRHTWPDVTPGQTSHLDQRVKSNQVQFISPAHFGPVSCRSQNTFKHKDQRAENYRGPTGHLGVVISMVTSVVISVCPVKNQ
ncbi:phospholipid phosphatase-related protein type 3 [Alosa pseudoharengus]|uniref:phospholipid phosphatase-related protein type 3 n=1 Tax=Alosa pseudoharengus TaxID=34774 RepID=UPI003F88680D